MTTVTPDDLTALWPPLPYEEWRPTYEHLHLLTQIAGKVRLALTPWVNHFWHVPFYVSPRGLTMGGVELTFDLFRHRLLMMSVMAQRRCLRLAQGERRPVLR